MYDKCYFCLDQLPKLKKESTASLLRKFWRSRGTKEPAYITVHMVYTTVSPKAIDTRYLGFFFYRHMTWQPESPNLASERPMALRANGSKTHYTHHTVHPHHDHRESSNVAPHGVPKVVYSHRVTSICTARISTTVNQFNLDHCWTKLLPQTQGSLESRRNAIVSRKLVATTTLLPTFDCIALLSYYLGPTTSNNNLRFLQSARLLSLLVAASQASGSPLYVLLM